ncbi:hypothetical protein [Kocuria sabuli]
MSGLEPLTVEAAGGTVPAPPPPVIAPDALNAAADEVIGETDDDL